MAQELSLDRTMPHDAEAEQSILGAILIDNKSFFDVSDIITAQDFYRESHSITFQSIERLMEAGKAIDLITLKDELNKSGDLERAGGIAYVASLGDGVPRSINIRHYANIVKDKSVLRELIHSSNNIISRCLSQSEDSREILDGAESEIFKIAGDTVRKGFVKIKDIAETSIEVIEELAEKKELVTGIPTGFTELDEMTAGLQKSDLIIIAARPSVGKTSLALNVGQHIGTHTDYSVGVFSLEMSKEQLFLRLLCSEALVDLNRLRTGYLAKKDWAKLTLAMGSLSEAKIYIDDTPGISLMEMKAKARRLKLELGLDILIIDYLQLMQARRRFESKNQEITYLSQGLKGLAKELDIPVIALSQLSRAPEKRTDHRPKLSDLRESGSIEQDADVVAFIFREEIYNPRDENMGLAEVIISKQRNGPTGTVELVFLKEFTKFENLDRTSEF